MKQVFYFLCFIVFSLSALSQCITNQEAINTPAVCKRGNNKIGHGEKENPEIVKDADKWAVNIYNAVIDPAIKKTTGLKGDWDADMGEKMAEGLANYTIRLYMQELGCNKDKKLYTYDAALDISVTINSLKNIAQGWSHTESKTSNNKTEEITIAETVSGRPVYILQQQSETDKYSAFAYYKKDREEKIIVVGKPGIPLFLPVSIKDVLLIKRANCIAFQKMMNKGFDERLNQTFESYLVQSAFPENEKLLSKADAEKEKESLRKSYESSKSDAKKYKEKNTSQQAVDIIDNYLKKATAAQLGRPCICFDFSQSDQLTDDMFLDDPDDAPQYVTVNPLYYKGKTPSAAQFVMVAIKLPLIDESTSTLTARKVFEEYFDFKKLQSMLEK
jgi:hypothetical protein